MEKLSQYLRETVRGFRNRKTFALTAILTIALGIGVNTAVFSVVHARLLAPLPYPNPDRLTMIWADLGETARRAPLSAPEIAYLRYGSTLHESIGGIWVTAGTLVGDARPEPIRVARVTSNFLAVLGVPPVHGRWFEDADGDSNAPPTMIISAALWQARFGGADVVGRTLRMDGGWNLQGGEYTIVGVMPPGFRMLLPPDASVPTTVDAWVPLQYDLSNGSGTSFLRAIGRLTPDATLADARTQLEGVGQQIAKNVPGVNRRYYAEPLHADLVREARPALIALQTAVGVVLLIACANIAGLLIVRGQGRQREMGIRTALGARRAQLAALLATESVLLALIGGTLGVALAYAGLRLLPALASEMLPRASVPPLSGSVLAFSALATLLSVVLFGLAPLLDTMRVDVVSLVKPTGRVSRGEGPRRMRRLLVLAQIGLAVVLLIASGLLIRTFMNLQALDPGFQFRHVLTAQISLPPERYRAQAAVSRFTRDLEQEMGSIPGVEAAGAVNQLPLDDVPNWTTPYVTRDNASRQDVPEADARLVTPGYFEALKLHVLKGRAITAADDETQPLVLVIDEGLARKNWPNADPVGQELGVRVWTGNGFGLRWGRVVGVIAHLRHHSLLAAGRDEILVPFAQAPRNQMGIVLRSSGDPEAVMRAAAQRLQNIDPNLALSRIRPLESYVDVSQAPARNNMVLATFFAGLSLLLACLGLYGIISYSVAQRTFEMGVRSALGAARADLMKLVMGEGMILTGIGVVIGLAAAAACGRWIQTLLFGTAAFDPLIFAGVPVLLALPALVACYVPARRAGVNPVTSLRTD